jgi:Zn-dependent membrane protease YugP
MDVIFIIVALAITGLAQLILNVKYSHYKKIEIDSGLTGKQVAEKILKKYDLDDIVVKEVAGNLTDHYNNSDRSVNLSTDIYNGTSIASTAVAAHECGHALQYKDGYGPIKLRNGIAKVASLGNTIGYIALAIGFLASITGLVCVGVALMFFAIFFQLVTLPVEFNASKRARKELLRLGLISESEASGVRKMLNAAGFTYVAGLLSSLLEIFRLLSYVRKK